MALATVRFPTEANTFASRNGEDACRAAIDHIMKALASGGVISNVAIGFVPVSGGHAVTDDDYIVVTVITDLRNVPQAEKHDPGIYTVTGGDARSGS